MRRRFRLLAGILSLVAMTLSFAETVWASTCAPMMDVDADVTALVEETPAETDCLAVMPVGTDDGSGEQGERNCPFGPLAVTQGCSAAASLPGHAADPPAPSSEGFPGIFPLDLQHDSLVESTLFRPPRA